MHIFLSTGANTMTVNVCHSIPGWAFSLLSDYKELSTVYSSFPIDLTLFCNGHLSRKRQVTWNLGQISLVWRIKWRAFIPDMIFECFLWCLLPISLPLSVQPRYLKNFRLPKCEQPRIVSCSDIKLLCNFCYKEQGLLHLLHHC